MQSDKSSPSFQNALDLPLQHILQAPLLPEHTDISLHILVCLCYCVCHSCFVHQLTVLLIRFL